MKDTLTRIVATVIGALIGMCLWEFVLFPNKEVEVKDSGKAARDSLRIEEQFTARLAQEKVKWADSINAFATDFEARILPPETIYHRNHEKALTADVAHMRWFMGQRPVDTAGSRYAP